MKEITILLTKHDDLVSNIIFPFCGFKYTHAAIGLEDNPEHFYSFNKKGFVTETIEKHRKRGVKHSRCYKIKISKDTYYRLKECIEEFKANKEHYNYNTLGVIMCILNIPMPKREKKYFCSQFVAEILHNSKAIKMPRRANLTKPNHFISFLERHPYSFKIENVV
jgi:hypothetical protein